MTRRNPTTPSEDAPASPGGIRAVLSTATWPVRRTWWAVQEKVLWRGRDAASSLSDGAAWPAERVAWGVRRKIVWPVSDLFGNRGTLGRVGLASTLAVAATAATFAGVQLSPDDAPRSLPAVQVAQRTPLVVITPTEPDKAIVVPPEPAPDSGPVLRGVTPTFKQTDISAAPEGDAGSAPGPVDDSPADVTDPAAGEDGTETPGSTEGDAGDETDDALVIRNVEVPLRVARRFARAFVHYEVGEEVAESREVFRETAAPALAKALADRPPRQPAEVEVPRAKVLNLVPGPADSQVLPVSVSLLRLGATSELRLDLELEEDGNWIVGDVRG